MAGVTGYPERYGQAVRRTDRTCLAIGGFALLAAALATPAAAFGRLPVEAAAVVDAIALFALWVCVASAVEVRAVCVFPYFESRVGGIDTFARGRTLARQLTALDALARSVGVRPLSDFGFADDLAGEVLVWHDPADGLRTVEALRSSLRDGGATVGEPVEVVADLGRIAHALDRARLQGIRFSLLLWHGQSTSAHEWDVRLGTAF